MANKNGHDDGGPDNVTQFSAARERREAERRVAADAAARAARSEPILNLPPFVKVICAALVAIQVIMTFLPEGLAEAVVGNLGFFAARYSGHMPFGWQGLASPVTHLFLHGGWMHLGINVATLAAFAAPLEKTMGPKKTAVLFFICGVIGAFTHFLLYPDSAIPLIGASGGISGLFGAVLMMVQEKGYMEGGRRKMLAIVAIWVLISVFFGYFGMPGASGAIAWTSHVGGFIAGVALYGKVARMKMFR